MGWYQPERFVKSAAKQSLKFMNSEQTIETTEEINTWAMLELFGHQKIAGRVTTRKLGTEIMFQVDVPKGETEFAYTRLFNPKALFSINPTTEEWCRKWANAAAQYGHQVLPYIPETPKQIDTPAGGLNAVQGPDDEADDDEPEEIF